jgi:hypothetical protein
LVDGFDTSGLSFACLDCLFKGEIFLFNRPFLFSDNTNYSSYRFSAVRLILVRKVVEVLLGELMRKEEESFLPCTTTTRLGSILALGGLPLGLGGSF